MNILIKGDMKGDIIGEGGVKHVTHHHYGGAEQSREGYSDEEVAMALARIVGKDKPINSKSKWVGAMWLLRWLCNYPTKAQEFCERIRQLPLPKGLEFPCEYENIRKGATLSFLNEDARQLEKVRYSKNDEQEFCQMRTVVIALRQELQKVGEEGLRVP